MKKAKQWLEILFVAGNLLMFSGLFWYLLPKVKESIIPLMQGSYYLLLVLIPVVVLRIRKQPVETLGFQKQKIASQLLAGILLAGVLLAVMVGVPLLLSIPLGNVIGSNKQSLAGLLYQLVFLLVFVGFGEEILFRGYFLTRIKQASGSGVLGVVLSSLLFGLWHYPVNQSLAQVAVATLIGMFLGVVALRCKTCGLLSLCVGHGVYDACLAILRYFIA